MLKTIGLPTLPTLRLHITGGTDDWQLMPDQGQLREAPLERLVEGEGVGRVGVAAARPPARISSLLVATPGIGLPAARRRRPSR